MRHLLVVAAVVLVCTVPLTGVGAAAHEEPKRTILGIELDAEGDAVVYYVQSHDLNESDQRERYESFADNESRRQAHLEDVMAELQSAAADGRNRTELEMAVDNGSVRTYEEGGFGRLEVRAEWDNLGFYNDRRVVVTEPFRGGYVPDLSRVAIHGPPGYRRATMEPTPLRARANSSLWDPRTANFSKFYAEFEDPEAAETDGTGGGGDDGGVGAFALAVLIAIVPVALVLLAVRRHRQ
jgi:hypothetical protein